MTAAEILRDVEAKQGALMVRLAAGEDVEDDLIELAAIESAILHERDPSDEVEAY